MHLGMQPAQRSPSGARVAVLHERGGDAKGGVLRLVVGLEEETAGVPVDVGLDENDVRQLGGRDFQGCGSSSSILSRYSPYSLPFMVRAIVRTWPASMNPIL